MTSGRIWVGIVTALVGAFVVFASVPLIMDSYTVGLGGVFIGILIMIFGTRYGRGLD